LLNELLRLEVPFSKFRDLDAFCSFVESRQLIVKRGPGAPQKALNRLRAYLRACKIGAADIARLEVAWPMGFIPLPTSAPTKASFQRLVGQIKKVKVHVRD
jgi:hypothetical protein